jgi:hypothetical protein
MPNLAIGPEAARATCSSRSLRALQHPYRASARCPSFAEAGTAASPYPAPLLMGLATHLDNAGKMPLTDICNRHFRHEHPIVDRLTPKPATFAAATASSRHARSRLGPSTQGEHGVGPPFGNPAPGRTALDGAAPASACSITFLQRILVEDTGLPEGKATSARRYRPRLKRMTRPLTLSVALRVSPGLSPGFCEGPRAASTALRQQEQLSRPKSAFHRHVRRPHSQASPATDLATLPPRSGFRRSFTLPMLSHGMARPSSITQAIRPGVARTTRRMSTSAINNDR